MFTGQHYHEREFRVILEPIGDGTHCNCSSVQRVFAPTCRLPTTRVPCRSQQPSSAVCGAFRVAYDDALCSASDGTFCGALVAFSATSAQLNATRQPPNLAGHGTVATEHTCIKLASAGRQASHLRLTSDVLPGMLGVCALRCVVVAGLRSKSLVVGKFAFARIRCFDHDL